MEHALPTDNPRLSFVMLRSLVLCRITSETFGPVVISLWRGEKMPSLYYFAAWTDSGCLLGCDHQHQIVMSATFCIACAGGYVVAVENGELRALEDEEEAEFQRALRGDLEIEYDANGCPVTVRIAWTSG